MQLDLVVLCDVVAGSPVRAPHLYDLQEVDSRHKVQLCVSASRPQHLLEALEELAMVELQGGTVKLQVEGQGDDGRLDGGVAAGGELRDHLLKQGGIIKAVSLRIICSGSRNN